MIERHIAPELHRRLDEVPAVGLVGPRQAGKTTLALAESETRGGLYLDLESEADRAKLAEPELYLREHLDRLVVLDEVHRMPDVFPILRGLIDRARRQDRRAGRYLLLGSGSQELLQRSGETLAGRISYMELTPFTALEVPPADPPDRLWVRGGFPESYLASDDAVSARWRGDFIRTYLERDIPQLGPRIAAETLRRFWTMLAHGQATFLNVAQLARNVGVDARTAAGYLDLLVDLLLVRRLPVWRSNVGKRLVRSPKVFVRDSGILHTLLGIADKEALLSHPVVGGSWEGSVIESALASAPSSVTGYTYRTAGGAEIDLVLAWPGDRLWAVEIKRSLDPRPERGFHSACQDLEPERRFVVYPGTEVFPIADDILAIPVREFAQLVADES